MLHFVKTGYTTDVKVWVSLAYTHRRCRRDSTRQLNRVGVGGVYWAYGSFPTASISLSRCSGFNDSVTLHYVAARRHIFVCFMAKSAFWRVFSALAPYTGVGPIQCLDEICSVHPPLHTLKIWGGGSTPRAARGQSLSVFFVRHATMLGTESLHGAYTH